MSSSKLKRKWFTSTPVVKKTILFFFVTLCPNHLPLLHYQYISGPVMTSAMTQTLWPCVASYHWHQYLQASGPIWPATARNNHYEGSTTVTTVSQDSITILTSVLLAIRKRIIAKLQNQNIADSHAIFIPSQKLATNGFLVDPLVKEALDTTVCSATASKNDVPQRSKQMDSEKSVAGCRHYCFKRSAALLGYQQNARCVLPEAHSQTAHISRHPHSRYDSKESFLKNWWWL